MSDTSNGAGSPLVRTARSLWARLPPVNFITLHYMYFIGTCLLSSVIFWGSSTPARSVSYTNSLFLCVSAMTESGLNTVNLSTLNTFQQFILFVLIMLGSAIFVSNFVVQVRRRSFEKKLKAVLEDRDPKGPKSRRPSWQTLPFTKSFSRNANRDIVSRGRPIEKATDVKDDPTGVPSAAVEDSNGNIVLQSTSHDGTSTPTKPSSSEQSQDFDPSSARIAFSPETRFRAAAPVDDGLSNRRPRRRQSIISMTGVGAASGADLHSVLSRTPTVLSHDSATEHRQTTHKYFPSSGFIGRNSQFHGLTAAEREHLGGVEYKALYWLSWIVPIYFVLWLLLGSLGVGAWVAYHRADESRENGINPWWTGSFMAASAFGNSGMSLLDANMTAFQDAYYVLITMSLLILAGNTCYSVFLRFIIWSLRGLMPKTERWKDHRDTLRFLLDHPRRCYTNLFQSRETWWLFIAVIALNGVDWAAFEILNLGNQTLYKELPTNLRVIDGLFQAFAVRAGGFYVVSIPSLRISLQFLYVVMMYISAYPVVITIRNSNVYEERSLGIYADDPGYEQFEEEESEKRKTFWDSITGLKHRAAGPGANSRDTKAYFVSQQVRAQLAFDAWWICLAIFLIMIIEGDQFEANPTVFSVFNVIFETVSAYGTVGISVGVPWADYSFCGAWHTLSKLVLCLVMIRGRHRGLPVAIDKAVLLPAEKLGHAEEEDAMIRMERAASRSRGDNAV